MPDIRVSTGNHADGVGRHIDFAAELNCGPGCTMCNTLPPLSIWRFLDDLRLAASKLKTRPSSSTYASITLLLLDFAVANYQDLGVSSARGTILFNVRGLTRRLLYSNLEQLLVVLKKIRHLEWEFIS